MTFVITCAGLATQMAEDRLLYRSAIRSEVVTVFKSRKDAQNCIKRTIRQRKKIGFFDEWATPHCYAIHSIKVTA